MKKLFQNMSVSDTLLQTRRVLHRNWWPRTHTNVRTKFECSIVFFLSQPHSIVHVHITRTARAACFCIADGNFVFRVWNVIIVYTSNIVSLFFFSLRSWRWRVRGRGKNGKREYSVGHVTASYSGRTWLRAIFFITRGWSRGNGRKNRKQALNVFTQRLVN